MILVCDTHNGWTVQAVGTDGKLYSFWGRHPMARARADAILRREQDKGRTDTVEFCTCSEDVDDALTAWRAGER